MRINGRRLLAGTMVAAIAAGTMVTGIRAAEATPPVGGCAEVLQDYPAYINTPGADYCRDRGWVLRPRLAVGPHGVVRFNRLPSCTVEDGGMKIPCGWNLDVTGQGLAYYITGTYAHHRGHYVWPVNPVTHNVGPALRWVGPNLADAMA